MGFIYKITSPTNRLYVGQTCNFENRVSDYRCLRHRSKRSIIIWSIKKYGWGAHKMEIIETVDDEMLDEREMFWINELKTYTYEYPDGMNLTKGGGGVRTTWKHDKERVAKAKLRCGVNSPGYGKSLSEEARKTISVKISQYNKANGKKPSPLCHLKRMEMWQKKVIAYDLNGCFVGEFDSVAISAKTLGIDRKTANDALNGKQKHGGKYIFKHKTENYPLTIEIDKSSILIQNRPVLCFIDNIFMEYPSAESASRDLGIPAGTIRWAFNNNLKPLKSGHSFIYKDKFEEKISASVNSNALYK